MDENQQQEQPAQAAETDADIAALQAATARRMEAAEVPTGEPEPEPVDHKAEFAGAIELAFRDGLGAAFPRVKARYTDDVIDKLAGGWAALAKKHNWGSLFGKYGVELFCAFVTVPQLIGTISDIRADLAEREGADQGAA